MPKSTHPSTNTNNVATLPTPSQKPQTSKEVIAANVKLLIEQLEAGYSEGLTAYLTAMGRFHNYSFGNILEIARQCPTASRTLQSTPESGGRAGYDGAKRRKGSKVHIAVDTLGHLLALTVTPADQGDRDQVAPLAEQVQQVTGSTVELAYVDQGYTGPNAANAAQQHGIRLEVVKHPMAKRGFVLLPRRWVVERSFAGPHASAASLETTNDSRKPSRQYTSSPSPSL